MLTEVKRDPINQKYLIHTELPDLEVALANSREKLESMVLGGIAQAVIDKCMEHIAPQILKALAEAGKAAAKEGATNA